MLKKISKLFLGLMVCAGSACVTPTHASSAENVIISHIQATGIAGAKDELIVVHNNSSIEVEVTNWCLMNKRAEDIACFVAQEQQPATADEQEGETVTRYFLPAYGDMTIASQDHISQSGKLPIAFSFGFNVLNQSSGSIVGSADTITLVNEAKEVMDEKSWSSPQLVGKILARVIVVPLPVIYAAINEASDWTTADRNIFIMSTMETKTEVAPVDVPSDGGAGLGEDGEDGDDGGEGTNQPDEVQATFPLIITELLANPTGADTGSEFIELYNPNEEMAISLDGLQLRIGFDTPKWYSLPADVLVQPLQYVALYNNELAFTLANTSGGVQLFKSNEPLGYRIEYTSPKDDYSWSLIEGVWQYTTTVTPGTPNILTERIVKDVSDGKTGTPKPCAENQIRNPDTGRCKLIAAALTSVSCKSGQERNVQTGRCRTIATVAGSTPCKEGQERNPETNRCRKVVKMTDAGHGVLGVTTESSNQPSWYVSVSIALVIAGVLAYAVWEWRQELTLVGKRIRRLFAKHAR